MVQNNVRIQIFIVNLSLIKKDEIKCICPGFFPHKHTTVFHCVKKCINKIDLNMKPEMT